MVINYSFILVCVTYIRQRWTAFRFNHVGLRSDDLTHDVDLTNELANEWGGRPVIAYQNTRNVPIVSSPRKQGVLGDIQHLVLSFEVIYH